MIPYYRTPDIRELMFGTILLDGDFVYGSTSSFNIYIPELMFDRTPSTTPTLIPVKNIYKSTENIHTNTSVQSQNFISIQTSESFRQLYAGKKFYNGDKVSIYINNFDIDNAMIVPF